MSQKPPKKLPDAELRRLAVASQSDPRSVAKVLRGEKLRGMVHDRVLRILRLEGLA